MKATLLLVVGLAWVAAGCQSSHVVPAEYSVKDGWQVSRAS